MNRNSIVTVLLGIIIVAAIIIARNQSSGSQPPPVSQPSAAGAPSAPGRTTAIGQRTKMAGCAVNGPLPDRACTPGAVIADATKDQICVPGYAKNVRNVPEQEKIDVYNSYGVRSHSPGQYEIDHLVSLELGGSNDIANLWPEAASPVPGFHEKDRYENYAHDQVCRGEISLQEAQQRIAGDWLKYWQEAGQP